jgi:hypothetical protein
MAVAVTATLGMLAYDQAVSQQASGFLDTVDPTILESTNGITLTAPAGAATVNQEDAIKSASAADPDYQVLEVKLVQLHSPVAGAENRLAWAVSMKSPGGELQRVPAPGVIFGRVVDPYYVTFVDAADGTLLFSAQGGRQIEPNRVDPSFSTEPVKKPTGLPPDKGP